MEAKKKVRFSRGESLWGSLLVLTLSVEIDGEVFEESKEKLFGQIEGLDRKNRILFYRRTWAFLQKRLNKKIFL